jgi:hypothetical protein
MVILGITRAYSIFLTRDDFKGYRKLDTDDALNSLVFLSGVCVKEYTRPLPFELLTGYTANLLIY